MKKVVVKFFGYFLILIGFVIMIVNLSPLSANFFFTEFNDSLISGFVSYSVNSYGLYFGFGIILVGLLLSMRKSKKVYKKQEVPVTENGKIIEYRRE